jgi:hypothetical protein
MIRSATSRIAGIALLAAVCAAMLLSLAAGASAKTSACSAHASKQARACAQSRRHRSRRPRSGSRHRKHGSRRHAAANGLATRLAPVCENGAKATVSAGAITCSDGSEPQCALNTTPVFNASGSIVYCTLDTLPGEEECNTEETPSCNGSTSSSPAAPACDDGSEAALDSEGVYGCDDGSEPRCGEGFSLSISESGTSLVCEPASEETVAGGGGSSSGEGG